MSQPTRPRLLVLTSTYPRWRNDHEPPFVHELARRLTDIFDVTVLAPHTSGAAEREVIDGVDVRRFRYAPNFLEKLAYNGGIPVNLRRRPWLLATVPGFLLAQFIVGVRLVRQLRPAVIHAHWVLPGGLVGALLKELLPGRRPLLLTAHGADVHMDARWPVGFLKRLAVESADVVTVVSRALRDELARQAPPDTKIEIAPMGVDLRNRFTPATVPIREPVLVFAGRLVEKKGVADLIEAMPLVLAEVPAARLIVAGHGPLSAQLEARVRQLQLSAAVQFVGQVENAALPEVLRSARLAVLPFRMAADGDVEGLGLVTIEAMGCGLPVIVGDVPAVHDVVEHAVTGWIVPAAVPRSLADAILQLLGDRELATRLAVAGRQHAIDRFDWTVTAARYRELLARLLH